MEYIFPCQSVLIRGSEICAACADLNVSRTDEINAGHDQVGNDQQNGSLVHSSVFICVHPWLI